VSNVKDVTELAPLLFVPQMLFVGFFISTSYIPVFLRWAQYLCSLKYAINIVMLSEFSLSNESCKVSTPSSLLSEKGVVFICGEIQGNAAQNCRNILEANQIHVEDMYIYIIILFAIFAALRILGGFILVQRAKKFY
jgi:hypothetical protein